MQLKQYSEAIEYFTAALALKHNNQQKIHVKLMRAEAF
jgi:hypothetical protein